MVILYYLCSVKPIVMYEQYLKYHHIPCGAVIDRIRSKEHLTQRELAKQSGVYYQRINDFIAGRRRISTEQSLQLEKALGITTRCFFYQIQTNHEIFLAIKNISEGTHPDVSKYRSALFWDTVYENLDWQHNSAWIIQRVFEYGNEEEIQETIRYYGKEKVIEELSRCRDDWNSENRNKNIKTYLKDDVKN